MREPTGYWCCSIAEHRHTTAAAAADCMQVHEALCGIAAERVKAWRRFSDLLEKRRQRSGGLTRALARMAGRGYLPVRTR